jgi:O-antigen/teichoic acid export membrane protein
MLTLTTFLFNAGANFAIGLIVAYLLGAEQFGVFALASAAGALLQTLFLEWLRLATNRFYGLKQGAEDSGIKATLDLVTGLLAGGLALSGLALYLAGGALGASALVAAMGPLIGVSNGLFDYRAAIARTCFEHKRYAALVIVRNIAAIVLMLGGAWLWQRGDVVLVGLCLSGIFGVLLSSRFYADQRALPRPARWELVKHFAVYSAPLVVSSLLIQANVFMTRSVVALHYGIAESGRYSLALDVSLRLVATLGSALDLVLFQYAVRAEAERGIAAAQAQISRNITIIVGIMLPATVGVWLTLPAIEHLLVAESFRDSFDTYTILLLPGLFCFSVVFYVVNPLFQIAKRTNPVIVAAAAGFAATAAVLFLVPGRDGGHGALSTSVGYAVNMLVMIVLAWRLAPVAVNWLDLGKIGLATLVLVAAAMPLRGMAPGAASLLAVTFAGAASYALAAWALNIGGIRPLVMARLRRPAVA